MADTGKRRGGVYDDSNMYINYSLSELVDMFAQMDSRFELAKQRESLQEQELQKKTDEKLHNVQ